MEGDRLRELAEAFYRAFLAADAAALAGLLDPKATWLIPFGSALPAASRGPEGIAALRRRIDELTGGSWRPLRGDSFDVAASRWHVVIMDRYLAERGERRLDSHEVVVAAVEEARIARLFHYVHDPAAFEAFWSA